MKNISKFTIVMLIAWLVSIAVFGIILICNKLFDDNTFGELVGITVIIGILAFGLMFLGIIGETIARYFRTKKGIRLGKKLFHYPGSLFLTIVIFLLLAGGVLGAKYVLIDKEVKPAPALTPQTINLPTPESTQAAKPVIRRISSPTSNPDPIVNCNIHANCGGGTKQMTKNDCQQSTCCEIGSNWYVYPNNSACDQAQENYSNLYKSRSTTNYPPCTVYYPALGYSNTCNYISPAQCASWQALANSSSTTSYPQETYSPQYTIPPDPYGTWTPTQYNIGGTYCYPSWEAYFQAHPVNAYNNVVQLGNPPCE